MGLSAKAYDIRAFASLVCLIKERAVMAECPTQRVGSANPSVPQRPACRSYSEPNGNVGQISSHVLAV